MRRRKSVLFMVVLGLILLLSGCGSKSNDPEVIKIGVNLELTGNVSTFGNSALNGVRMAVEEANAAGGIDGKQIQLVVEDNKSDPAESANATKKLIEQDHVQILLGAVTSSCTLAAAPIAQASGVPMLTPGSTNPQVTETGDYIFRSCFLDSFQGTVIAKFAINSLQAKTAAIFNDVTSDQSKGLSAVFKKDFEKMGGKVIATESFAQKDTDFNAQLTKIKVAKPDVIFLPAYYNEAALIVKQARQLGVKQAFVGIDGWDSPKLAEIAGTATNRCYFSNHYSAGDQDPIIQKFVRKYQEKYQAMPDTLAELGYEGTMVIVDALKRAKSTEHAVIRDALAATKDVQGVTGKITLDENRNPIKSAVMIEMKEGKQRFLEKITP